MIYAIAKMTVKTYESTLDKPIILYRGDKNVEIMFQIYESGFKQYKNEGGNIILNLNATYGQFVARKPDGTPIVSEITETKDGKVVFVIPPELIDETTEVGRYTFQIRLYNEAMDSRVTLPAVVEGIEIIEPIASQDGF